MALEKTELFAFQFKIKPLHLVDDVLMAIDASGGGLKKITRSNLVSGLATSSAISNVSEDWTIGSFFISTFPESNVESTSLALSKGGTEQRYKISALTENESLII